MRRRRTDRLRPALALTAFTALLLLVVQATGGLPGEEALARWARRADTPAPVAQADALLAALGTPAVALATVLAFAWIAHRRLGPAAGRFMLASTAVAVIVLVVKVVVGPTDPWADASHTTTANFPSGHVAYATAVFGAAALLAAPGHREVSRVLWLLVAAMGPSRIIEGVHVVSDVLAGYAVGAAWLLVILPLPRGPA